MTSQLLRWVFLFGLCLGVWVVAAAAQEKTAPENAPPASPAPGKLTQPNVVNVLGLAGVPPNTSGTLTVEAATLRFDSAKGQAEVPVSAIDDIFTDEDSQRLIGGVAGTLSTFAPYESGRFLSLFRKKIDSLTIEYRDGSGGLHGAILRMPKGVSAVVKKQLVTLGARASIPVEQEMEKREEKQKGKKDKSEKKP